MTRLVSRAVLVATSLALAVPLALVGCGGAPPTPSATSGSTTAGAAGRVDTSLRADAPMYATVRAAQIAPLFGVLLFMFEAEQSASLVERLALDPVRPSGAALDPLDATLEEAARHLAALVPTARDAPPAQGTEAALAAAAAPARDAPIHGRVVLATTRPASTFDVLGTLLTDAHFTKWPRTPQGFDGVYAQHDDRFVLALLHDDHDLVVEALDYPFAAAGATRAEASAQHARVQAELESIRGGSRRARAVAPALADGELGRIIVLPRPAATLDFVAGVGTAMRAIAQAAPSDRSAMLGAGLFEAAGALALVGDSRGPYAERIEIVGRGSLATVETTTRITLGPALVGAIAPAAPTQGTTIAPMEFGFAEASGAARAVPLPRRANEPSTPDAFQHILMETGGTAPYFYALPHVIVFVLREILDEDAALPIPPPIRAAADRIGMMAGDHDRVRYALLPPTTTAVEAALALPHATGTPRPRMLSLGQVTTVGNASAMTVSVGDRFAVLVSGSAEMLRAARLELTPPSTAAATATISITAFTPVFALRGVPLPATYRLALEATPTEWILRGSPGPASP